MTTHAPPGWYPDPSGAPGQRWWDGQSWSASTMPPATVPDPAAAMQPAAVGAPAPALAPGAVMSAPATPAPYSYPAAYPAASQPTYYRGGAQSSNRLAFITFGVVALYLVIALETHFVVFGFLPLGLSLRSKRLREPLAPFAIAASVLAIAVAAIRLFGH